MAQGFYQSLGESGETSMNYELIELTIHFENKESECMIVSLDSIAHQLVRDYVQANGYELIEKPIEKEEQA